MVLIILIFLFALLTATSHATQGLHIANINLLKSKVFITMSKAAATNRLRVLGGYRRLFRARQFLFAGDDRALAESKVAIRQEFVRNKTVQPHGPHFEGLMQMIDEAADMLRHDIVQGQLNEKSGHYGKCTQLGRRAELAVSTIRMRGKGDSHYFPWSMWAEVKVRPEHTEGVEHMDAEPITSEVVAKMEKPMVTNTKNKNERKPT